jgi:hypothetical protein
MKTKALILGTFLFIGAFLLAYDCRSCGGCATDIIEVIIRHSAIEEIDYGTPQPVVNLMAIANFITHDGRIAHSQRLISNHLGEFLLRYRLIPHIANIDFIEVRTIEKRARIEVNSTDTVYMISL